MIVYPAEVYKVYLEHQGGTKFYELTRVVMGNEASLVIRRFGKVKTFGEVIVTRFSNLTAADKEFSKLFKEKTSGRKGYKLSRDVEQDAVDLNELRILVGRGLFAKLSPEDLKHIDPAIDTSGVRDTDKPRYSEDGEYKGEHRRMVEITEEMMERERQEQVKELAKMNPLYGRF